MTGISNGASSPRGATARSLEAYLLPHLLDVAATSLGRISALFVGKYAPVVEGQPLAQVERTWQWPPDRGEAASVSVVRAPASGLISRCWGNVGEAVWPMRRLFSIASSENVLVVARFAHAAAPCLRANTRASILLGASPHARLAAKIVSVAEPPDEGQPHREAVDDGTVRVILRLDSAPAEVLWPGTPAQVEV